MTVSDAATRVSFAGNGSTTAFSFPHYFPVNGDLTVIKRSSTGVETVQTITTHYTVSGAGNPSGGTVTMVTAPASGETLVILRELDETQELALTDNDSFAADSFELALDRTVLMIQQLNYDLSRAIKMPRTDSSSLSMALPSSIGRANKAIVFDASGNVDVSDDDYNDQLADVTAQATAAASSASAASTSATSASSSASAASTSASSAATSASSASTSATSASTSATNAATSATSAATSATNAVAQATGLRWNFDSSTTMADPGTGDLRLNNATISSVTAIAVSANSADTGNPDVSDFVVTWDDSTNTNRGTLTLRKIGTPATFATFTVTGSVTDSSTFLQFSVTHVASNGTLSDGDQLIAQFARSGDKGVDGVVASIGAGNASIVIAGTAAIPTVALSSTPALGTPTSGTLTNCAGLPVSTGVSGLGLNVAAWLATPTTANFAAAISDEATAWAASFGAIPQNSQSTAYTAVLADANKHLLHPSADTTARTFTIPANSSVAYPIGTTLTFVNQASAGTMTISITTDTMRLAGAGTTGSRTLAANGIATALKITSTEWIISGTGLT